MSEPSGPSRPLCSIVMTVFNGETHVREAIESALAQMYEPLEVVVVDDGSRDGSAAIAESYVPRIRFERRENGGIGVARNHAVGLTRGDFLTFLDADDRFVPNACERWLAAFETQPELDAVFCHVREFLSPELDEAQRQRLRPPIERIAGRLPTAMMVRRDAFFRVGPFSTELRRAVGVDWAARAMECGLRTDTLPDVLLERRLHAENHGLRHADAKGDYARALKAALDRRRRAGSS